MLWTNYHCHTQYCDGRAVAENFVKTAVEKKLSKLGFSPHSPVPYHSDWNMKTEDLPEYINEILTLRENYRDRLEILIGMEVDYIPHMYGPQHKQIQALPTDFLIASVHYLGYEPDGTPWTIDGSNETFDKGIRTIFSGDIRNYAKQYTQVSCDMMEQGGFDIVGHIDKMFMHASRHVDIDEKWYRDLVSDLLYMAASKDLIVEINTKSFYKHGMFYPHQSFFKLLSDLNIRVTINSDTHFPDKIDLAFYEAADALISAGIRRVTEYINGSWQEQALTKKGVLVC